MCLIDETRCSIKKFRELTYMSQVSLGKSPTTTKKKQLIYIYMFHNSIECHVTSNTIYHSERVREKMSSSKCTFWNKEEAWFVGGARAIAYKRNSGKNNDCNNFSLFEFVMNSWWAGFLFNYLLNEMNQLHFAFNLQCISVDICSTDAFHHHMQLKSK